MYKQNSYYIKQKTTVNRILTNIKYMFCTEMLHIQLNNLSEINDNNTGNSTQLYVHKCLLIEKELECQIL